VSRGIVLACRTDGMGERLNGILNGIRLAQMLRAEFKFTWSSRGLENELHAIEPAEAFFGAEYRRKHLIDRYDTSKLAELAGSKVTMSDLRAELDRTGCIIAPRVGLREILSPAMPDHTFDLRDCFASIEFAAPIKAAVDAAMAVPLPSPVAGLHLRAGDVFYGDYRKYLHYTYKGLSVPIAKAMIGRAQKRGQSVVVLGQDDQVLTYLKEEMGVILGREYAPSFASRAAQAMFELRLLARADVIMGGSSGFAKQASWINGSTVELPGTLFTWREQQAFAEHDLERHADFYHPLQTAFAYWYLFFYGRQHRTVATALPWLERASEYDPENEMYPLVRAGLLYRVERDEQAERLLERSLLLDSASATREVVRIFTAQTTGRFNLAEFHPAYKAAAVRGNGYARFMSAVLRNAEGATNAAKRELETLRGSIAPEILRMGPQ
jgi:tetratricopeptide (TPR) repeat protein